MVLYYVKQLFISDRRFNSLYSLEIICFGVWCTVLPILLHFLIITFSSCKNNNNKMFKSSDRRTVIREVLKFSSSVYYFLMKKIKTRNYCPTFYLKILLLNKKARYFHRLFKRVLKQILWKFWILFNYFISHLCLGVDQAVFVKMLSSKLHSSKARLSENIDKFIHGLKDYCSNNDNFLKALSPTSVSIIQCSSYVNNYDD